MMVIPIGIVAVALTQVVPAQNAERRGQTAAVATREKQKISYKAPAANTKYTQQHLIEIDDVPGHQIRVFELQRTYPGTNPAETPIFNGVHARDSWSRAMSDYVDANGRVFGYVTYDLENGEKVFARYEGISQTSPGSTTSTPIILTLTGGTGNFKDIRGTLRVLNVASFSGGRATPAGTQYEGEYWFEK